MASPRCARAVRYGALGMRDTAPDDGAARRARTGTACSDRGRRVARPARKRQRARSWAWRDVLIQFAILREHDDGEVRRDTAVVGDRERPRPSAPAMRPRQIGRQVVRIGLYPISSHILRAALPETPRRARIGGRGRTGPPPAPGAGRDHTPPCRSADARSGPWRTTLGGSRPPDSRNQRIKRSHARRTNHEPDRTPRT